jgi:ABC-type branched-subunit amino acid transport system substrate-binding protein
MQENGIKQGDKLGIVYFEGEFGENFLTGARHVAEEEGLELVEQKIKATDVDMSGPVAALRREKVDAIVIAVGPRQTASLAGVAAASGLNVPIMASGPGFDPALLETPAAKALEANVKIVGATAPYGLDAPGVRKARETYEKAFPKGRKHGSVMAGWAESQLMFNILSKACQNKDLTRDGLQTAVRQLNRVDLQGVVAGTLDYTQLGQPPSKSVYINKIDPNAEGGVVTIGGPRVSENAKGYKVKAE